FRRKAAGLRTTMMICFCSALYTILSGKLAGAFGGGDHTRIAAQIISGLRFIGAGSILREQGAVGGLASAATTFVAAAVGMAAGGGLFLTATFSTLVVVFSLVLFGWLEAKFFSHHPNTATDSH